MLAHVFFNLISPSPAPHFYSCRTQEYGRRTTVKAGDATTRLWVFAMRSGFQLMKANYSKVFFGM